MNNRKINSQDSLDFFSGGVPTGANFGLSLEIIRAISRMGDNHITDHFQVLCLIGLLSYFEAFCKDHFASLINIEPSLIECLRRNGQETHIDAKYVSLFGANIDRTIGFILAEKYDFGTAQKINSLYMALIRISPFSKDE